MGDSCLHLFHRVRLNVLCSVRQAKESAFAWGDLEEQILRDLVLVRSRDLLEADLWFRVRDEPEDVHQLRVTTRRLRALLRTARPMFEPEWAEAFRAEREVARA